MADRSCDPPCTKPRSLCTEVSSDGVMTMLHMSVAQSNPNIASFSTLGSCLFSLSFPTNSSYIPVSLIWWETNLKKWTLAGYCPCDCTRCCHWHLWEILLHFKALSLAYSTVAIRSSTAPVSSALPDMLEINLVVQSPRAVSLEALYCWK